MSSSGSNMPRLGPGWRSSGTGASRGFQPPPAVPDERSASRERSGSHASGGSGGGDKNRNPFAMLDDEDDGNGGGGGGERHTVGSPSTPSGGGRFSALRSDNHTSGSAIQTSSRPFNRASSTGSKPSGRSLADLAAKMPSGGDERRGDPRGEPRGDPRGARPHGDNHHHHRTDDHHREPRTVTRSSSSGIARTRSGSGEGLEHGGMGDGGGNDGAKVLRYTREKLLSLRGRGDDPLPQCLKDIEGSVVVSDAPQDPVCWDSFDAEEIWAAAGRDRKASDRAGPKGSGGRLRDLDSGDEGPPHRGSIGEREPREPLGGHRGSISRDVEDRGSMRSRGPPISSSGGGFGGGGGRWQRGVAVPEGEARPSSRGRERDVRSHRHDDHEADDPEDLWDDPGAGGTGAAGDFSAFGGSLDDEHPKAPKGHTGMDAFEMSDMSKAAAAFENELHADRKSDNGDSEPEADDALSHNVDPRRPLASTGTIIRGGSGDHANVFEDFGDEPSEENGAKSSGVEPAIKSGKDEGNASSRLMKMIGVSGTGEAGGGVSGGEPIATEEPPKPEEEPNPTEAASAVSSNPWGAPAPSLSNNPWGGAPSGGNGGIGGVALDSFAASKENEAAAQRKREEELQRQQKEAEEKKRMFEMQQKQQAEMQAAQQRQQEAVKAQQNQVELVLIERISNILENSWGRSDLSSILSTMHANDSRVIAILSTTEALRALVARHPQRIQLGRDPTMGAEMAAIRMTNVQWQAHQAQQAQVAATQQAQQEAELQRRQQMEEQARQQQKAQQEALARAQKEEEEQKRLAAALPPVIANAPWYYADPQGNVQGPFSGDEMRQWLEAGYFKGDLPISQNSAGPFKTLGSYFSDSSKAFHPTEDKAAVEAKARAEAEARARAAAEEEAQVRAAEEARAKSIGEEQAHLRVEEEARAKAAAEEEARLKAEADAQVALEETHNAANQSNQLKMMLGLGASASLDGVIAGPPQPEPVSAAAPQSAPAKKEKAKKKQQQQQQQPSEPVVVEAPAPEPAPAAPPAPAWGGAAVNKPAVSHNKSMSEIQQEEAREAARRAKVQGITGGGQQSGGGWANIAATGGSTAWGGAAKPTIAAAATPTPAVAGYKPAAGGAKKAQQNSAASAAASKKAADDNFGANGRMTPTFESWCKEQMQKLNGTDDLTLVSFCMTLVDKDEIRQYLTAYLGSSPQVNNFATEFIKRKSGDTSQNEWESAGGPKKGRKKKGGK